MLQVVKVQKVHESTLPSPSLSYSGPFCGGDQYYWFLLCSSRNILKDCFWQGKVK